LPVKLHEIAIAFDIIWEIDFLNVNVIAEPVCQFI
jgi:hypothetical protein